MSAGGAAVSSLESQRKGCLSLGDECLWGKKKGGGKGAGVLPEFSKHFKKYIKENTN